MPAPTLPPDLVNRVQLLFPAEAPQIVRRLEEAQASDSHLFCDRILRCVVYAAFLYPRFSIQHHIREAQIDYRDIIMATEYDRKENHVHDFKQPFRDAQFATRNRDGRAGA